MIGSTSVSKDRRRFSPPGKPSWETWDEIPNVCFHRPFVRRTIATALIVGTTLFMINQLDVVMAGGWSFRVWCKVALTYVVPFVVSNYGLLVATRRSPAAIVRDGDALTEESE